MFYVPVFFYGYYCRKSQLFLISRVIQEDLNIVFSLSSLIINSKLEFFEWWFSKVRNTRTRTLLMRTFDLLSLLKPLKRFRNPTSGVHRVSQHSYFLILALASLQTSTFACSIIDRQTSRTKLFPTSNRVFWTLEKTICQVYNHFLHSTMYSLASCANTRSPYYVWVCTYVYRYIRRVYQLAYTHSKAVPFVCRWLFT